MNEESKGEEEVDDRSVEDNDFGRFVIFGWERDSIHCEFFEDAVEVVRRWKIKVIATSDNNFFSVYPWLQLNHGNVRTSGGPGKVKEEEEEEGKVKL